MKRKRGGQIEPPTAREFFRALVFVLLVLLMGTLVAIRNMEHPAKEVPMHSDD